MKKFIIVSVAMLVLVGTGIAQTMPIVRKVVNATVSAVTQAPQASIAPPQKELDIHAKETRFEFCQQLINNGVSQEAVNYVLGGTETEGKANQLQANAFSYLLFADQMMVQNKAESAPAEGEEQVKQAHLQGRTVQDFVSLFSPIVLDKLQVLNKEALIKQIQQHFLKSGIVFSKQENIGLWQVFAQNELEVKSLHSAIVLQTQNNRFVALHIQNNALQAMEFANTQDIVQFMQAQAELQTQMPQTLIIVKNGEIMPTKPI